MARKDKEREWSEELRNHLQERTALGSEATFTDEYNGAPAFQKYVLTEQARTWTDFLKWLNAQQGPWYYRGQKESTWPLVISLDRSIWRRKVTANSASSYYLPRGPEERQLLFRFQQQAHQYVAHLP